MALDLTKLTLIQNGGPAPSLWSYDGGADTGATMDTAGYFNNAADRLRVGDFIFASANAAADGAILRVNANAGVGGTVDCNNVLGVTGDTD